MTPEPRHNPDSDDPCDGEMVTLCDSGRSEACTGDCPGEMVTLTVWYLRDPIRVCAACAAYEARQTENAEPDPLRAPGLEGGVCFDYLRR